MLKNRNYIKMSVIAVTFILILATGIMFKQKFVLMVPLFISLFIMAFQAEANRYAVLAGGINAIIYGLVYIYLGLYATAASALLFSCPMQLLTFFNWQKNAYEKSVVFKKMSSKQRIASVLMFVVLWAGVFIALLAAGSKYAILDNTSSLLGIAVTILTMLAYIEYSYLWIISSFVNILLNIQLVMDKPEQITYLIYSIYSFYCVILAFINVRKLYNEQQEKRMTI